MQVLLVSKHVQEFARIQEALEGLNPERVDLTQVSGPGDAHHRLARNDVDLILLDLPSPGRSSLDSATRFCMDVAPVPVIVLSGQADEQTGLQALQLGAQDFLLKDSIEPELLARTVRSALRRGEMRAKLERSIAAQERAEAYLRTLIDAWPGAVAILDSAGRLLQANTQWQEAVGTAGCYGPGFSTGDDYLQLCEAWSSGSLRDSTALAGAVSAVCAGSKDAAWATYRIADAAGDHWFEARVTRLDIGPEHHVLVSHIETTSVRAEEHARRQDVEIHRDALETIRDGYYEADLLGRFTLVNRALRQALDRPVEKILGATFADLGPEPDADRLRNVFRSCLATGEPAEPFEWKILTGHGSLRHAEVSLAMIHDSEGRIVGFRGIVRDVNLRKAIEAELESYYVEVEEARNRAEVQAMELASQAEELVHAHNEALAATQLKSEFMANVSHEILTPMNGIVGMVDLLEGTRLSREQRDYVQSIKDSTGNLLTLINGILDFSKIEAGNLELDRIPFNVAEFVAETLRPLSVRAHEKELELLYEIDNEVPATVIGDPSRLRQILVNLTENAIKFTHEGEVSLRIGVDSAANGLATVRFEVSDTGIGIPADKQQIIFESFAQGDGSSTREFGGAGLGLAISGRLVHLMNGQIWVESREGGGSTFSFTARMPVAETSSTRHLLAPFTSLEGVRAVVADDNPTSRRQLASALQGCGVEVHDCGDGRAALELLGEAARRGRPFDIAVLDCQMPVLDGFATTCRIQGDPRFSETNVVLLTLSGRRGDAARCRRIGVSAYLTKPIAPLDLIDAVRALIRSGARSDRPKLVTRHSLRETRKRLRVLVAGDNPVNQLITRRLLQKAGHQPVMVRNGQEALESLERQSFDVIFMDLQMPEMDGFMATEALRGGEAGADRHLPVIALSSNPDEATRERCLRAGIDAILGKPFELIDMITALDNLFPEAGAGEMEGPVEPPAEAGREVSAGESVVDGHALLEHVGGDRELLNEIVEMFLREREATLGDLADAVSARQAEDVERAAQRLESTFGTLAAEEAVIMAANLARFGREGRFDDAEVALGALENKIMEVERELSTIAGAERDSLPTPRDGHAASEGAES
jgi:PAS domain S-box-containing protein